MTDLRNMYIKLVVRVANLAKYFISPLTLFRVTGFLPYRCAPDKVFTKKSIGVHTLFRPNRIPKTLPQFKSWTLGKVSPPPDNYLIRVPRGTATGTGRVFDHRGRLIWEATRKLPISKKNQQKIKKGFYKSPLRPFPAVKRVPGELAVLASSKQHEYFHWLFDVLPSIDLLVNEGYEDISLFIAANSGFQIDSLNSLGIDRSRIIDSKEYQMVCSDTLVIATNQIYGGHTFPSWIIDFLRAKILYSSTLEKSSKQRRLFISRQSASHRRVSNEQELVDYLQPYGFECVKTENYSVVEQAKLFNQADIIIAPHGGGLSNLVFCNPETKIIELFPGAILDVFYRLSHALKLDYYYVSPHKRLDWRGVTEYSISLQLLDGILRLAKVNKVC